MDGGLDVSSQTTVQPHLAMLAVIVAVTGCAATGGDTPGNRAPGSGSSPEQAQEGACASWTLGDDASVFELDASSPTLRDDLRAALSCCTPFEGVVGPFAFGEALTFRRDGGEGCETLARVRRSEGGGLGSVYVCDFREITAEDLVLDDASRVYESFQRLLDGYCTEREGDGQLGLIVGEPCRGGSDLMCVEASFCHPDADDTCADRGGVCEPLARVCSPDTLEQQQVCACDGRAYSSRCEARQLGIYGPLTLCDTP